MPDTRGETNTPAAALVWKARPIFLSSTFRDMHAELDYLREHGFKEIEARFNKSVLLLFFAPTFSVSNPR